MPLCLQENTKGSDSKFITRVMKDKLSSSVLGTVFPLSPYMMFSIENQMP